MNYVRLCNTQLLVLANWFLADPRRLTFYAVAVVAVATVTIMAAAPLLVSHPIYLAPNGPGGSGGSG